MACHRDHVMNERLLKHSNVWGGTRIEYSTQQSCRQDFAYDVSD